MKGVHRRSQHCWYTSDDKPHASRAEAQRHERQLVLLAILTPLTRLDGTIPLTLILPALLDCQAISITYPAGATR